MEKLNELVELAKKATSGKWIADSGEGWDAIISQQDMVNGNFIISEFIGPDSKANKDFVLAASPENILAIAEAFRALEQEVQKNLEGALAWQQRAEAAEAKLAEMASEQKPFMYGIMTANGDAHFEDFCVSSDPGLLEDVIWEWNNTLADNEPKNRVVPLFTRSAPAINLAELVPDEMTIDSDTGTVTESGHVQAVKWWNACRAAILRRIEEAG